MINKINYSPSFQKQLKAKVNILNNNKPEQCFIYELNEEEDLDYFKEIKEMPEWREKGFAVQFHETLEDKDDSEHLFVMESKDEECLGILELDDDVVNNEFQRIEYIETYLPCSSRNGDRSRKYIGQTLLAFAAKSFDESKHKKGLRIPSAVREAVNFYISKCHFNWVLRSTPYELILLKEDFDKLINTNEQNTKGKIELVG